MSKYMRPILIGVVVGFVVSFGMGFLYGMIGDRASSMPMIMGAVTGSITAYILANLSGIRARPAASSAQKTQALDEVPPAGKAFLYLYREGFVAKLAGLNVAVDGKEVVQLKSPRFTCVTVAPGSHTVSAAFGGLAGPQNNPARVTVEVPAGAAAALRMTMKMGALKNSIDIAPMADLNAVKNTLAGMVMTQLDVAEV